MPKTKKSQGKKITSKDTLSHRPMPHEPKKVTRAKVFSFVGVDKKRYDLTLQQKLFCERFCEFSMNGIDAIIEAGYNVTGKNGNTDYKAAAHLSHENLLKPNINAYITVLFERYGLNDDKVDKQLLALINQNAELSSKARGLDMYYKKTSGYAPEKHELGVSAEL